MTTKCEYFGVMLTLEGVKTNDHRVGPITQMQAPTDKKGLQVFLRILKMLSEVDKVVRTTLVTDSRRCQVELPLIPTKRY